MVLVQHGAHIYRRFPQLLNLVLVGPLLPRSSYYYEVEEEVVDLLHKQKKIHTIFFPRGPSFSPSSDSGYPRLPLVSTVSYDPLDGIQRVTTLTGQAIGERLRRACSPTALAALHVNPRRIGFTSPFGCAGHEEVPPAPPEPVNLSEKFSALSRRLERVRSDNVRLSGRIASAISTASARTSPIFDKNEIFDKPRAAVPVGEQLPAADEDVDGTNDSSPKLQSAVASGPNSMQGSSASSLEPRLQERSVERGHTTICGVLPPNTTHRSTVGGTNNNHAAQQEHQPPGDTVSLDRGTAITALSFGGASTRDSSPQEGDSSLRKQEMFEARIRAKVLKKHPNLAGEAIEVDLVSNDRFAMVYTVRGGERVMIYAVPKKKR